MKTSKSVYDIINERIIEEFENGVIPWQKPWKNFDGGGNFISPLRIPLKADTHSGN